MLEIRLKKANNYIYKVVYYTGAAIWGYLIMKDLEILPTIMGGPGECSDFFRPEGSEDPMFTPVLAGLMTYSLVTMGYHIEELVDHLFIA
jgi:hypothetical protein